MSALTGAQLERMDAEAMLRKYLKPGDVVYVVERSVAKSGMSRTLDLYAILPADHAAAPHAYPRPIVKRITRHACRFLGSSLRWDAKAEAARIDGCGMDMHFEAVYRLSYALFGDGKALSEETL